MGKLAWYKNRLAAMSREEIFWRLDQKRIQRREKKTFDKADLSVVSDCFYNEMAELVNNYDGIRLPLGRLLKLQSGKAISKEILNSDYSLVTLGGLDYKKNKTNWKAGIQTENQWPDTFSYKLDYKGRDDIGDARCNWELNRHFQFAALACRFCGTGKKKYFAELQQLIKDWTEQNPFLKGISWTSTMEVAIRSINWMIALGFLEKCKEKSKLKKEIIELEDIITIGIVNMICYCQSHYSRFSSANNHTLVEAAAIGIAGAFYDRDVWKDQARSIITEELEKQIYPDGVGKECSLHYQAFGMEAIALLCYIFEYNKEKVPEKWKKILSRERDYLYNCCGEYDEIVVFGDEDEGKIIDLLGEIDLDSESLGEHVHINLSGRAYYDYVLRLVNEVLDNEKPVRESIENCICYKDGGISLIRDKHREVLVGFDHGELGYGSIAAHGHADALSVRTFYKGKAVFSGPGTYLYHCDIEHRNIMRDTKSHNTITINDTCQSQMLGAFLWGRRAESKLIACESIDPFEGDGEQKRLILDEYGQKTSGYSVIASQDGYVPIIHQRNLSLVEKESVSALDRLKFMPEGKEVAGVRANNTELDIVDTISGSETEYKLALTYNIGNDWKIRQSEESDTDFWLSGGDNKLKLSLDIPTEITNKKIEIREVPYAPKYGMLSTQKQVVISGEARGEVSIKTKLSFPARASIKNTY